LTNDAQQVLNACVWYYNRVWHKGINAIPFEVSHAYNLNQQDIVKKHIPLYPVGSVILRKPIRMGVFNFDPEPFVIN
jgi:hypothetical protein